MVYNFRNIVAFLYSIFLYKKIKLIKQKASEGKIIISTYFHNPSEKLFEKIVKWFLKNGFNFISTDQLHDIIHQNKLSSSSVVLTVDDGWKENKDNIVKIANKYNIPVTIFLSVKPAETGEAFWWSYVTAGNKKKMINQSVNDLKKISNEERLIVTNKLKKQINIDREALTIQEVMQIATIQNITIGSHTMTHPILKNCTDAVSFYEISESKKVLSEWVNRPVKYFAYPNGDYTSREINYLQQCGYQLAFTTIPEFISKDKEINPFEIPRFDVLENVSLLENICRATGVWFLKNN